MKRLYGYDIIDGKAVINELEAETLKSIIDNYLNGMSMKESAKAAGIEIDHSRVKQLVRSKRYRGDDFYPQIITQEMADAFEQERLKREKSYKGVRKRKQVEAKVMENFKMNKPEQQNKNPIKQFEYLYSLLESEG